MSTFCVFGLSKKDCEKVAFRKIKIFDSSLKRDLTASEHAEKYRPLAASLFDSDMKSKQVSPAFDAPHFAEEWIVVAEKTDYVRHCVVMVKGPKKDKNGDDVLRKGKPVITWVEYKP